MNRRKIDAAKRRIKRRVSGTNEHHHFRGTQHEKNPDQQMSAVYNMTVEWANRLEQSKIVEYTELLYKPWALIWRNLLSGTARGIGIAIGFTFFAATIIYVLQFLGALNLPIIGDYIADIVRIVQRQLELNTY